MNQGLISGFIIAFYKFGEYFVLLLYLNFLWICFTLLGGVVFGWAPSTVAVLGVLREKLMDRDPKVFSKFWQTYKQEFLKANGFGILLLIAAYMLFVNIRFFSVESAFIFVFVRYAMIAIMVLVGLMTLYVFPLMVQYETKLLRHIQNAMFMVVYKPIRTIFTVIACVVVSQILYIFPIFIPFFGISLFALVIMWTTYYTFLQVEKKQQAILELEQESQTNVQ
ncbi:YesL family protein [Alkalihalobacillus trypoxylicola]|uniref:DUF624 domain-containing protein n=1 Tax=Alkalihalobacillus trypoxylicola TaxID=519424 RepID=A0A162EJ24_9BACI|nr:DUF624 domain-containing protein [Alkalihalobacillus trypoxylicola]KYG33026.1 hypothetical protein AZF04_17865 [Alkalihalobacillus trypoxylicola]GAF66697.1 hypothetical protein BTS2_3599 [Bacillus sp. TS-2]